MSETISGVSILSAETKRALVADVQFFETYTSAAFNRKMRGIVKPGFYAGFDAVLAGGLKINITSANESGKRGVASVDVGEYQISVQQVEDVGFTLPAGATTRVVLEANYQNGVKTNQVDSNSGIQAARLFLADVSVALAGNQLELCRFTVPAGTVNLTQAMLSKQNRPDKSIGIELSNDAEGSTTEGDAYKAATIAALKRALALSVQARGELPDTANLNKYGPTPDRVGQWSKSTATGATIVNGYPENDAIGVVEVSKAGASNGTQRFTLVNGNVYTRSLTAAWNGVDGPWGAWNAPYEEAPFPDVWIPLNDSLTMLAGFGPYDRITFGDQYAELPTRSVKLTRATTATYIDKSGVLQVADINEPRFEKEGLLIEGQSTNLLRWSSPVQTSGTFRNSPNVGISFLPAGGVELTKEASTGFWFEQNTGATDYDPANSAALSVNLKFKDGLDVRLQLLRYSSEGDVGVASISAVNGRNTLSIPVVGGTVLQRLGLRITVGDTVPIGEVVIVDRMQIEPQAIATSYIPTNGTPVTRAADDCTFQRSGNDNWWGPITISVDVHCSELTSSGLSTSERRGILAFYPSSGEYAVMMLDATTTQSGRLAFAYGNATFNFYPGRIDDGKVHRVVSVSDTLTNKSVVDSGNPSNPTVATKQSTGAITSGNTIILLGSGAGATVSGQRSLNGHIRNLRIWHKALTPNQIKGLR
ncbi:hypothetical protein K9O81_18645 [Leclercia adecarboxylata]|uniref:phage head spike fiber domain-containing protein n=1 Tax=Leclercia adecarboxylata TaxID=83655 RepID=UPI001CC129D0|nr:hypothetical protein [Leclercia adecarboxylata]MBZ3802391.1 hypothetical protein [Leclercia adecarboxylata]MBZ3807027.1 hypothetical protein [Leclercia adecarboxylata]